jgi:catechol 2,3-dioxygenase-like lactoylglutathione lyase family enzyme
MGKPSEDATAPTRIASGRGQLIDPSSLVHLAIGTFATTDLQATRRLLENFLGMECVDYAAGRMMARDRRAKFLMERGDPAFFVLDAIEIPKILRPQAMLNHWGFSVASEAEVDRIREIAVRQAVDFDLKRILPTTGMHGSYGFYMIDKQDNWWEIEFRKGVTNDLYFSRGDWNAEGRDSFPVANPPLALAATSAAVVGDEAFLTHGTMALGDADASRTFYEDILRLRTVRHVPPALVTAGAGDFGVVGLSFGAKKIQDQLPENRFVILVDGDDAVADLRARVQDVTETYGLLSVSDVQADEVAGASFVLRTADRIWFEISSRPRQRVIELFEQPSRH